VYDNKERDLFRDENHDDGQVDQFVGFMSLHRTFNIDTCFHIHSFVVFHMLKNDTIITCMLTARDHILSNMQDRILQIMQLIHFCHAFKFLVTITNDFIGDDVGITKWYLAVYEAMGFNVTPLTQDTNQNLFSFDTEYPIPVAFYFDCYTWAKYGKIILSSTISLEEREKTLLHSTFWKSFQQFLCIDLDRNLSSSPSACAKGRLGKYLSTLFEGQSETATKTEMFAAWVNEPQHKEDFIKKITKIALSATIIPLSIFTQFFHWRFLKHTYLETSLEMMQQAYIVKETESKAFYLIPGDTCLYFEMLLLSKTH
jgi:hypothetical protein